MRTRAMAFFFAGVASTLSVVLALHGAFALPKDYSPYRKLGIFAKVLTYVENNYVEHVDDSELIYGAIDGMLQTLDAHSVFMPPDQYRQLKGDTQGQFSGVGIEVEIRDGWITIVSPIEGTPAFRAGLKPGDRIIAIDGKSTKNIVMHEAVRRMRGEPGTSVALTIRREGSGTPLLFELERAVVKVVSVSSKMLAHGIGYVRIKTFQERTDDYLRAALEELGSRGKLRGLVLDLRNNPGGLLEQAVRVADVFLEEGLIVTTRGKGGRVLDAENAHSRGTYNHFPMVCLLNRGSASASEIVAGALQDQRRAVLMGEKSFGKGSVQTLIELEDGSALKLTVANYTTPAGRSIQGKGIAPDIVVPAEAPGSGVSKTRGERQPEPRGARRAAPAPAPDDQPGKASPDFQLETALNYLHAAEIFGARRSVR